MIPPKGGILIRGGPEDARSGAIFLSNGSVGATRDAGF